MSSIKLTFFAAIFSTQIAIAQTDAVLGPEPTAKSEAEKSGLASVFTVGIGGGFVQTSYSFTSSEYKTTLKPAQGSSTSVSVQYASPHKYSLTFKYHKEQTDFANATDFTPDFLPTATTTYSGLVRFNLSGGWLLGAGLQQRQRTATSSLPYEVMTSGYSSGVLASLAYRHTLSAASTWSTELSAYIPNRINETPTYSGFLNVAYTAELSSCYRREFRTGLYYNICLEGQYNYVRFSGTGNRGTTNARETTVKASVPFVVEMDF